MFIGVKLVLTFAHEEFAQIPKIPTVISLGVIASILAIATIDAGRFAADWQRSES